MAKRHRSPMHHLASTPIENLASALLVGRTKSQPTGELFFGRERAPIRTRLGHHRLRREPIDAVDLHPIDAGDAVQLSTQIKLGSLPAAFLAFGAPLPPGATTYPTKPPPVRSRWREFQFALHRVTEAIAPAVGLAATLAHWNDIAAALAERNRKRKPQLSKLRSLL
jgi:hypothetical protein